jgi:hypothetical protein
MPRSPPTIATTQNYILTAIGQVVPQQQQQQEDIPGLLARARDKQQVMEEEDGI